MKAASDAESGARTLLLMTVALLVALHLLWQIWLVAAAPYPAHYDFDEGVYGETAAAAAAGGRLYTTIFLSQPPLLITVLAHTFGAFGRSLDSARSAVVAFSILWLASVAWIAARANGLRGSLWATGIAASAPAFAVASHTVQMEAPAEALAALAVALGLAAAAYAQHRTSGTAGMLWGMAGLAAGFALMTKFSGLTCFVPLAVILGMTRPLDVPSRTTVGHAAVLVGAAVVGAAGVLLGTGSLSADMWRQTVIFHKAVARATPIDFGRTASLLGGFAAANWLLTVLGLAGLAALLMPRRHTASSPHPIEWSDPTHNLAAVTQRAAAAWLAADIAVILVWRPVWPHHLAILITPLAVLGAAAIQAVWRSRIRTGIAISTMSGPGHRNIHRLATGTLLTAWLAAVATMAWSMRPQMSEALRAAAVEARRAIPATAQVIADDPLVAFLADRNVPAGLCDTSEMRMRAGWVTAATLRAALADPQVRGIVLWRGTFRSMAPAFVEDAAKQFPHRWTFAGGRGIFAR